MMKTIIRVCTAFLVLTAAFPAAAQIRETPQSQEQIQLSFSPVVKEVSPAVVNIYTSRTITRSYSPFMNDPFFSQFFGDSMFGRRMKKQAESSLGSGVIADPNGLIVTNAHVIRGADEITVALSDGRELEAELAIADEASDLALLRVQNKDPLPYVDLKPSESLEVGDIVLAIGNPFGVGQTVTSGIVSAQGRSSLNISDFNFFIQTDAAINPGNSGGPLVSLDGKVVGINSAIYSRDGGSLGIGFAIPSEMVASVIAAEKQGQTREGAIIRPWLGVSAQGVTSDIGESLALAVPRGALINALHPASPLKKAGMKVGDVVTTVNGNDIHDPSEMKFRMATIPLGEEAEMLVARAGKVLTFRVKAIAPPEDPPRQETLLEGRHILSGATVANLNPAISVELGVVDDAEEAVVILKAPRGSQASRFVSDGDLILSLNGQDIKNVDDIEKALKTQGNQGWSLVVNSNGRVRQIRVR